MHICGYELFPTLDKDILNNIVSISGVVIGAFLGYFSSLEATKKIKQQEQKDKNLEDANYVFLVAMQLINEILALSKGYLSQQFDPKEDNLWQHITPVIGNSGSQIEYDLGRFGFLLAKQQGEAITSLLELQNLYTILIQIVNEYVSARNELTKKLSANSSELDFNNYRIRNSLNEADIRPLAPEIINLNSLTKQMINLLVEGAVTTKQTAETLSIIISKAVSDKRFSVSFQKIDISFLYKFEE